MGTKTPPQQRASIVDIITGFSGQDANIVIPRTFLKWCNGDLSVALFLSQCLYWSSHTDDPEGWFARTVAQWEADTTLTRSPLERAAVILEQVGLERDVKRSRWHDFTPVVHYRFIREHLESAAQAFFATGAALSMESTKNAKAKLRTERETRKSEMTSKHKSEMSSEIISEMSLEHITEMSSGTISYKENTKEEEKEEHKTIASDDAAATPLSPFLLEASSASHSTDDAATSLNQGAAAPGLYPCTGSDINTLIAAWMRWTPPDLLPTFRGRVVGASKHYANNTIRGYAQVLWERGYRPNDFVDFLRDLISRQKAAPDAYISGLPSWSFAWVASRVEKHAVERRRTVLYTHDAPRCFPAHPKAQSGNAEAEALLLWAEGKDHTITGYSIDLPCRLYTAADYELLKAGTPLPELVDEL